MIQLKHYVATTVNHAGIDIETLDGTARRVFSFGWQDAEILGHWLLQQSRQMRLDEENRKARQ